MPGRPRARTPTDQLHGANAEPRAWHQCGGGGDSLTGRAGSPFWEDRCTMCSSTGPSPPLASNREQDLATQAPKSARQTGGGWGPRPCRSPERAPLQLLLGVRPLLPRPGFREREGRSPQATAGTMALAALAALAAPRTPALLPSGSSRPLPPGLPEASMAAEPRHILTSGPHTSCPRSSE